MAYENLSPPRQTFVEYVSGLALFEGGDTHDVIRSGGMELWPGRLLVAQVLNSDPRFLDPDFETDDTSAGTLFSLTVYDISGEEVESIAVDPETGWADVVFEESELSDDRPLGAPDFMIESFLARYSLIDEDANAA